MSTVLLPFVLNFHLAEIHNLIVVGEDVLCQRQKKKMRVKHREAQFTCWGEWHEKQNNGGNELEERKR